jgi:hypothetical protein
MCPVPYTFVFCSSLISCFNLLFFRYLTNDSEMVPLGSVITGITFVFTFHIITKFWKYVSTFRKKNSTMIQVHIDGTCLGDPGDFAKAFAKHSKY